MKSRVLGAALALAVAGGLTGCTTDSPMGSAQFVGSDKCGTCHTQEFASWKDTYHNKMVRPTREGMLKDALDGWAKDAKGNAGPTKGNVDGKPYPYDDVVMVVGSKWKQRYLVKNAATGNHQFLDKQWNRYLKIWEGYGNNNDWETNCATCHATGYKVTAYDPANPAAQKSSMSEKNTGCEACHGPGSKHVASTGKVPMFNPGKASKAEADKVCGYCHIRNENYAWQTAQKRPREDLPAPAPGMSYRAGTDDWTQWYLSRAQDLLVGIQPGSPFFASYKGTDLDGAFFTDAKAEKDGLFEARKHHEQYQEFIQSKHAQSGMGCSDCHSPHAVKGKLIDSRATCAGCHGDKFDYKTYMPGLGRTAGDLYVRSHTFNPAPRKGGATADDMGPPVYAYPQK
ncbi:MAG: multiheme c-type cytochrome [Burkholderiaceae bacterium]